MSYTIGAAVALGAVAAVNAARRACRAAVGRRHAKARWERRQAAKQRECFIDPEQDS